MGSLLIVLLLAIGTVYAECIDSLWISSPGTQNTDQGTGIVLAQDGNAIACGYYDVTGIAQGRGWLLKVNPATGDLQWSRQYVSGGGQSIFTDIYPTSDGGFICGGWSRNPASNDQDYWLFRVNSNGDSMWSRTFGHEFPNQATSVLAAADDGYVIAGRAHTLPNGFGNHDWSVIKTDANGDSLWSQQVGGELEDNCADMILTPTENYLLVGNSLGDSTRDGRMAEINSSGDVVWTRLYTFDPSVEIHGAMSIPDGYVACGAQHAQNADNDVMMMQVDMQGNLLWRRKFEFDIPGAAVANSVLPDSHDGYYLVGHAQRISTTNKDVFVLHVSSCGDSLGIKWVGNAIDEEAARAVVTNSGEIVTAGVAVLPGNQREMLMYGLTVDTCNIQPCSFARVTPQDSTMPDLQTEYPIELTWTRSLDPEGAPIQYIFDIESTYPESFFISPLHTVSTDTFYHLELMLPVSPLDEIFDFRWTVKATDGQDTIEASNGEGFFQLDIIMNADEIIPYPLSFILSAAPNPFNPTTTLSFMLNKSSLVTLELYDIQGRHVQSLVNEFMSAGSHDVNFDGSTLSSGIYFAKLQAGTQSRVAKLVLMK